MIIELTGSPGAGKSTVENLIVDICSRKGIAALSAGERMQAFLNKHPVLGRLEPRLVLHSSRIWNGIRYMLEHPSLLWTVLSEQQGLMLPLHHRFWGLYQLLITLGVYHFLRRHMTFGEVAIFSEGVTHRAATLFTSHQDKPSHKAIIRYMKCIPHSDLLIFVQAPIDLCVKRVTTRDEVIYRLRDLGSDAVYSFIKHQSEAIISAVDEALYNNRPTIKIENTDSFNKIKEQLEENIIL